MTVRSAPSPRIVTDDVTVFVIGQTPDGELLILSARGHPLPPPYDAEWAIRQGCMIQTIPADKVYPTQQAAEARVFAIKATGPRRA